MKDTKGKVIQIGDIVKVDGSPVKQDNAVYVVAQDGTNAMCSGKDLTMYRVARVKGGGYALSNAKYNIAFYPLICFSNKYKFSREELSKATIEVIVKASPEKIALVKDEGGRSEPQETEKDYFYAAVMDGDRDVANVSYRVKDADKLKAFLSNLSLKGNQTLSVIKHSGHDDYTHLRGFPYLVKKSE